MDSILPVLIFIILRCDIEDIIANILLVQHFVSTQEEHKVFDKMVTNVFVSAGLCRWPSSIFRFPGRWGETRELIFG